jgi:hypothetical protein
MTLVFEVAAVIAAFVIGRIYQFVRDARSALGTVRKSKR